MKLPATITTITNTRGRTNRGTIGVTGFAPTGDSRPRVAGCADPHWEAARGY